MRFLGGSFGITVTVLGVVTLVTIELDPQKIVNAVFRILFGLLIITAEVRLFQFLMWFKMVTSFTGLGLFYIFVAGFAVGTEWWEYIIAFAGVLVGLTYIIMGMACKSMGPEVVLSSRFPRTFPLARFLCHALLSRSISRYLCYFYRTGFE